MIYLISYVPNLLYNSEDIHSFITNHLNPPVDWWYYSGVYLLDTSLTISQITRSLRVRYPNLQHFVVKVDLNENGGLLPKEAWDWIDRKTQKKIKLKTLRPIKPLTPVLKLKPSSMPKYTLDDIFRAAKRLKEEENK
jgi:hypothetical protein